MTNTLITGGTGLVGSLLAKRLENVWLTSRNSTRARQTLSDSISGVVQWDAPNGRLELKPVMPINSVVNLMGESVAKGRWTLEKKGRIRDSRVIGTQNLVKAFGELETPPKTLISASAVGLYGDHGEDEITESSKSGSGFLADVCREWESSAMIAAEFGIRVVLIRIGIVLSADGGALAEMLPIFRKGLGGRLGSGQQFFPWIHIEDLVSMIVWAIKNESVTGPLNAVAPNPVTNSVFTKALASSLNRPAILPVPKFAIKLALGEFGESLFDSQRVVPSVAQQFGFEFRFPNLDEAVSDLV